jgi:hypothetical protein
LSEQNFFAAYNPVMREYTPKTGILRHLAYVLLLNTCAVGCGGGWNADRASNTTQDGEVHSFQVQVSIKAAMQSHLVSIAATRDELVRLKSHFDSFSVEYVGSDGRLRYLRPDGQLQLPWKFYLRDAAMPGRVRFLGFLPDLSREVIWEGIVASS